MNIKIMGEKYSRGESLCKECENYSEIVGDTLDQVKRFCQPYGAPPFHAVTKCPQFMQKGVNAMRGTVTGCAFIQIEGGDVKFSFNPYDNFVQLKNLYKREDNRRKKEDKHIEEGKA